MSASDGTIKLPNGDIVAVACQVCCKPATHSLTLRLCQKCASQRKDSRKREGEALDDEVDLFVYKTDSFAPAWPINLTSNIFHGTDDDEVDIKRVTPVVEIKRLDRPNDESGFDGNRTTAKEYFVEQQAGQKPTTLGYVDDSQVDPLKMLPSAVNYPPSYCSDPKEAGALIQTWLTKSSHHLEVLFTKPLGGVFLGPELVEFMLPVIECRLQQIIEFGITDGRWRGDRIYDERVGAYRRTAKTFDARCKELGTKIKTWNEKNQGAMVTFDVSKIVKLATQLHKADRPLEMEEEPPKAASAKLQPSENDTPAAFTLPTKIASTKPVVAVTAKKVGTKAAEAPKPTGLVLPFSATQPRLFYEGNPAQKAPTATAAPPPLFGNIFPEKKLFEGIPTTATKSKADIDLSMLFGDLKLSRKKTAATGGNVANKNATEKAVKDGIETNNATEQTTSEDSNMTNAEPTQTSTTPACDPKNPYPLPALTQDEIEDLEAEIEFENEVLLGEFFPLSKERDSMRMEMLQREKQLKATLLREVKKREWICSRIEELTVKTEKLIMDE